LILPAIIFSGLFECETVWKSVAFVRKRLSYFGMWNTLSLFLQDRKTAKNMGISSQNPQEITGASVFHQKLRDLVTLLEKNSAAFEIAPEDLAALRDGESELAAHLSRGEAALRFVGDTEIALDAARVRAARAIGEYRIARLDIAVRMEQVLARLPETAERTVHRATLRELLGSGKPDVIVPVAVPENLCAAPISPGAKVVELSWVSAAPGCGFEIEAARSRATAKPKQSKTATEPLRFETVGKVSETRFVHPIVGTDSRLPAAGTVLYYRVRSFNRLGEISSWSPPVCAAIPASPKSMPFFSFAHPGIAPLWIRRLF